MQVSGFHWADVPDVGPKFFCGHGSTSADDPTRVHTDLADAANMCVFATDMTTQELEVIKEKADYNFETTTRQQKREPAALWHVFHRGVYADLVRYVLAKHLQ